MALVAEKKLIGVAAAILLLRRISIARASFSGVGDGVWDARTKGFPAFYTRRPERVRGAYDEEDSRGGAAKERGRSPC